MSSDIAKSDELGELKVSTRTTPQEDPAAAPASIAAGTPSSNGATFSDRPTSEAHTGDTQAGSHAVQPAPARKLTAAEAAAARRARILGRGTDRMALVTGEIKKTMFEARSESEQAHVDVSVPDASAPPTMKAPVITSTKGTEVSTPTAVNPVPSPLSTPFSTHDAPQPTIALGPTLDALQSLSSPGGSGGITSPPQSIGPSRRHVITPLPNHCDKPLKSEVVEKEEATAAMALWKTSEVAQPSRTSSGSLADVEAELATLQTSQTRLRRQFKFVQLFVYLLTAGLFFGCPSTALPWTSIVASSFDSFIAFFVTLEATFLTVSWILMSRIQTQLDEATQRRASIKAHTPSSHSSDKSGTVSMADDDSESPPNDLLAALSELQTKFETSQYGQFAERLSKFLGYLDIVQGVLVRFAICIFASVLVRAAMTSPTNASLLEHTYSTKQ